MMRSAVFACALVALCTLTTSADDKKDGAKAPDAKLAAMMEAWAKHATIGDGHKKLEPMIGAFAYTGKWWSDPSAPPSEMSGTSTRRWLMGGRFMEDKVSGKMQGSPDPFEGIGLTGYDNALKKYAGIWIDNMSTSVMTSEGKFDAGGKVYTTISEHFDPVTGKMAKGKEVTTIKSKDEHTAIFYNLEGGKEIKTMELNMKRVK